jgi:ECF sigma factor
MQVICPYGEKGVDLSIWYGQRCAVACVLLSLARSASAPSVLQWHRQDGQLERWVARFCGSRRGAAGTSRPVRGRRLCPSAATRAPLGAGQLFRDLLSFFLAIRGIQRQLVQEIFNDVRVDEEDVALSAFNSFCRQAEAGRFPELLDRDSLWCVPVVVTARKAFHLIRDEPRQKRGGGVVVQTEADQSEARAPPLEQVLSRSRPWSWRPRSPTNAAVFWPF